MKKPVQPTCLHQAPDIQAIIDELQPRPLPPVPQDLETQTPSNDPLQRLRQIDQQMQHDEERIGKK